MARTNQSLKHHRAAQAVTGRQVLSFFPGLLLFLFAMVSFSLGHAQALPSGRAGALGAEKPGQTLYTGSRDANRAAPVIERKDQPQTAWTGDDWGLPSPCAFAHPEFSTAQAASPEPYALAVRACRDRLPRGPPLFS